MRRLRLHPAAIGGQPGMVGGGVDRLIVRGGWSSGGDDAEAVSVAGLRATRSGQGLAACIQPTKPPYANNPGMTYGVVVAGVPNSGLRSVKLVTLTIV